MLHSIDFNRFATPEFSNNGEWGFLCDSESPNELADTIIEALSDKRRLREMGKRGQAFVIENYKWEKTVYEMCKAMEEHL